MINKKIFIFEILMSFSLFAFNKADYDFIVVMKGKLLFPPIILEDGIFVLCEDQVLRKLDVKTGLEIKSINLKDEPLSLISNTNGGIYVFFKSRIDIFDRELNLIVSTNFLPKSNASKFIAVQGGRIIELYSGSFRILNQNLEEIKSEIINGDIIDYAEEGGVIVFLLKDAVCAYTSFGKQLWTQKITNGESISAMSGKFFVKAQIGLTFGASDGLKKNYDLVNKDEVPIVFATDDSFLYKSKNTIKLFDIQKKESISSVNLNTFIPTSKIDKLTISENGLLVFSDTNWIVYGKKMNAGENNRFITENTIKTIYSNLPKFEFEYSDYKKDFLYFYYNSIFISKQGADYDEILTDIEEKIDEFDLKKTKIYEYFLLKILNEVYVESEMYKVSEKVLEIKNKSLRLLFLLSYYTGSDGIFKIIGEMHEEDALLFFLKMCREILDYSSKSTLIIQKIVSFEKDNDVVLKAAFETLKYTKFNYFGENKVLFKTILEDIAKNTKSDTLKKQIANYLGIVVKN